jgi:TfoX/Sxy family transcriptional regulator of competence genes
MFGEYGLYLDGKIIGGVHDDVLHLKNVAAAATLLPGVALGPPYPGAKPHLIADPWLDDPETLAQAAWAVARSLPPPKPKAVKPKKA